MLVSLTEHIELWRNVSGSSAFPAATVANAATVVTAFLRLAECIARTGMIEGKDLDAAFSMLVAADWLGEEQSGKKAVGGRPTVTYHVNPRLWAD